MHLYQNLILVLDFLLLGLTHFGYWGLTMGSVITSKKGLLKLVKGQINVEVDGSNQPAKDGEQPGRD